MATYAIGDLQGCCRELSALLDIIGFSPKKDRLWLVGDLVNRGPDSLATLRLVKGLGASAQVVLGNHDLHFLAVFYGGHDTRRSDTLDELLSATDVDELAAWLRDQPLVHHDPALEWLMVHAGVPPQWSLEQTLALGEEARKFYAGQGGPEFFAGMYGNTPDQWHDDLAGLARVRCIVNYLTRMRLVDSNGTLDFSHKGAPTELPAGFSPWFLQPRKRRLGAKVAFGHWAALEGRLLEADSARAAEKAGAKTERKAKVKAKAVKTPGNLPSVVPLDTGCVWGRELTALCLESGERWSVPAGSGGSV